MVISDDSGHTYVLDVGAHTFTIDGVQSYPMTHAQESALVPVLAGIVDADRLADAACQTGPGGGGINHPLTVANPYTSRSAASRHLRVRRARGPRRAPVGGMNITVASGATGSVSASDYSCLDIANAMYGATLRFRSARDIALHLFREWARDLIEVDPATGAPRFRAPNPAQWGMDLSMASIHLATVQLELNVMATLYRAQGCWTGSWPGLAGGGFGGGGGVGYSILCHSETGWEISVDGGASWAALDAPVLVCEYVAA